VLTVFAGILGLQLLVAAISIDAMSAVRAYVTGESLYSKGQKDAQIYLIDYAEHHDEADYQRFLRALDFPIGDRIAREALQRPEPDVEQARRGLLQGGTHPGDIPGVIRLFRWFHKTPLMADSVATWTDGDALVEQIRVLADKAHRRVVGGDLFAPEVTRLREDATLLNRHLTDLEIRFAKQLGDGARLTQRLLLGLNLVLAVLLGATGLAFVRKSSRMQAATEEQVRLRQESLQRLLDSAAEGLYGVDTRGRCTFINRAALKMLGYERESDVLGRDMHELVHHSHADGSPRPPGRSRIAQSYRERRELHVQEDVFWRRDGTSFPVEYWSHPMFQEGRLHGAVATFFDITDRKNMQAAVRQGEIRIAGLVDAVNDGVMTVDADERIVLFNRAAERLFGVPAKDAIGSSAERFVPRHRSVEGAPPQEPLFKEFAVGTRGAVRELTGVRVDGSEFPLEASLSRLDTDQGTLVTAVLRDISDLQIAREERQARQTLEAASRAKTEFLSRMSHELRTPLNAVLGFSQLLRLDSVRPPSLQQLERIQHIENAGSHLLALVNDVLDLSRVESGTMTVTLEPVDIRSAIEDAVSMIVPLAATAAVAISIEGFEDDSLLPASGDDFEISVLADRLRLRQVLVNLLSNAVKYNHSGGHVWIGWRVDENRCRVRIKDDGAGMAPDRLERLFEPFNRLGAEHSKIEGTGIGLVLSRRLAGLMGGELHIDSAVDRGTVASLSLVCSEEAPVRRGGPAPPSQHGSLDATLRVLYAEDNDVNVELVRQIVKLRPSVVLDVAVNGASALDQARRHPPDLMLVDMNLGDMTGLELVKALREHPSTAALRMVALSADALPEQINAALVAGFADYLTKPIDFRELLNVLDGRRHR
jgi:PAS domain S-box-containing protein